MKKSLQFLAAVMLFAIAGTNFSLDAKLKKHCPSQAKPTCNGSCEWRHNKCRDKVKKSSQPAQAVAATGTDAAQAPAGSIIMYNLATSLNKVTFVFYDANVVALTAPATVASADSMLNGNINFKNRPFVIVPSNAKFMDVVYSGQNPSSTIKLFDMLALNISPSSLPQMIGDSVPADSPIVSLGDASNTTSAVIVYDFMLEQEVMPPLPSSGLLKLNVVLDHNDSSCKTFFAFKTNRSVGVTAKLYQPFTPTPQFAGSGLVGKFYSNNGSAEISDPSGANPQDYVFISVMSQAGNLQAPANLTLIGSMPNMQAAYCSNCPESSRMIYFYGTPAVRSNPQPMSFTPAPQFSGPGLTGIATFNSGTISATISDPTGANPTMYSFTNVINPDPSKTVAPANLTLIGSWTNTGMCPQTGCVGPRMLNFYGTLVPNNA